MSEKLRVSREEREAIVRGAQEDFPKYTSQLLNLANQNAQSTRSEHVGKMKAILNEFANENPEGTYDDWVEFYMDEYHGEQKLENSADLLYEMIKKMRQAMAKIDREMAHRYVEQLVLYKTYMGSEKDIEEVIFKKLEQIYSREVRREPNDRFDGLLGDTPFEIKSMKDNSEKYKHLDIPIVYYRIERDNSITIDSNEIDEVLGTSISDNGVAHRRLNNFSFL